MNRELRNRPNIDPRMIGQYIGDEIETVKKYIKGNLFIICEAYGYGTPNEIQAPFIVNYIMENFKSIRPNEIPSAFAYAAKGITRMEDSTRINLNGFGKTVPIPIIQNVLEMYVRFRNMKQKKVIAEPDNVDQLNKEAYLKLLEDLSNPECKIREQHFRFVEKFIHKFDENLIERTIEEEKEKEVQRISVIKATSRKESIKLRDLLKENNLQSSCTIIAQVRIVKEWIKENIEGLDTEKVRKRIINS